MMDEDILKTQIEYYRARAGEYDASILGDGGVATGTEEGLDEDLVEAARLLKKLGPFGQVLELACGTGIWTRVLVTIGKEVTAVDAAPEMLELARQKLGAAPVRYQQADLFRWEPSQDYDLVFFAFWLSHVPPVMLNAFLNKACQAVRKGGELVIIDQYAPTDADRLVAKDNIFADRPLRDGRTFTIVKVFYDPDQLRGLLRPLGFDVAFRRLGDSFFFLSATRS